MISTTNRLHVYFRREPVLPALRAVHSPRVARRFARALMVLFALTPPTLLLLPWQQTVSGSGRVVAFSPNERPQNVHAPIDGRVMTWHVVEGSRVKAGDLILELMDNDPDLMLHLTKEREAILDRRQAARERVERFAGVIAQQEKARDGAVRAQEAAIVAARKRVEAAQKSVEGAVADKTFARFDDQLQKQLLNSPLGLTSKREALAAEARMLKFEAEVARLREAYAQAQADLTAAESQLLKVASDASAAIENTRASKEAAEAEVAAAEQALQQVDIRIFRQKQQEVRAPRDGTIFRVTAMASEGGQYVKAGEVLATVVPDTTEPVVELFIDGLDAPLIDVERNPHVRLQFEGWPAVQFAGWPSVAVGTFGGKVILVDSTDNGMGQFRILVAPDRYFKDDDWPSGRFLRQGNRANGWVFLNRVSIGYELWRRMNGFPPVIAKSDPDKDDKGGKKDMIKLPKVGGK